MVRRLAMIALAGCATGTSASLDSPFSDCDAEADLGRARVATETYDNDVVAIADGFAPQDGCDVDPFGAVMGIHYVRVGSSLDQEVDVEAPDALLYVPYGDGVRLVGIEYVRPALIDGRAVFDAPTDPDSFDPPPSLFCRSFDGPMEGHVPGQPWHHDLHVWMWRENPSGYFEQYNSALSCP